MRTRSTTGRGSRTRSRDRDAMRRALGIIAVRTGRTAVLAAITSRVLPMSGKFVPTTGRPRSMTDTVMPAPMMAQRTKHFDVLIVGAGISGIGGAYHLTQQCPGTSFVVLETQETFGGTWWTHRYPGIRSAS